MSLKEKKKLSCHNCRKIKRRCDGEDPCSNCLKRNAQCEYSQTDRRSQRFSVGYIKSLETNNEVLQNTLSLLVTLRNEPEKLAEKLASLAASIPKQTENHQIQKYSEELGENLDPSHDAEVSLPIVDEQANYFGPGSIYHFQNFPKPDGVPMIYEGNNTLPMRVVTLELDFEYIRDLVVSFFDQQYPMIFLYILDRQLVLAELEERNFSGQFLSRELVYAICANSMKLKYAEADAYYDLASRMLFMNILNSTVARAQAYFLISFHQFSKGQMLNGWLLSGLALRAGYDVGFDYNPTGHVAVNRFYCASILCDLFIGLAVGRKATMKLQGNPVWRLPGESETDYMVLKNSVDLVELSRDMIRATYQPIAFDKDPKINYLLKFNRCKAFNMQLMKWKSKLDPVCHWLYASLKASKTIAKDNHTLKYLYYHILLFTNKPFIHIQKQYLTMYIIEEILKEMFVIVSLRYQELQLNSDSDSERASQESDVLSWMRPYNQMDPYNWASMDVCLLTLLCHVLVTLIVREPEHYLYLEKHFKLFCKFLSFTSPRKYKDQDNPVTLLYGQYMQFKAKLKASDSENVLGDFSLPQTLVDMASDREPRKSETSMLSTDSRAGIKEEDTFNVRPMEAPPLAMPQGNFPQMPVINEHAYGYNPSYVHQVVPMMENMELSGNHMVDPNFRMQAPPNTQEVPGYYAAQPEWANVLPDERYTNYDQLPPAQDPVNRMVNQMFSNTGQEFAVDREKFNWDALFKEDYLRMM